MENKDAKANEMKLRDMLAWDDEMRTAAENRPVIEFWPDEWADWVSSHRGDRNPLWCHGALEASPFCPLGWH